MFNNFIENLKTVEIDQALAVRLLLSSLALYNAIANMIGLPHLELSTEEATTIVNAVLLFAAFYWVLWKNNNFTLAAKEGQVLINILKENPDANIEVDIKEGQ